MKFCEEKINALINVKSSDLLIISIKVHNLLPYYPNFQECRQEICQTLDIFYRFCFGLFLAVRIEDHINILKNGRFRIE